MRRTLGLTILAVSFFTLPASAAIVESVQGPVAINRGEGFQKVAAGTQANAGDLLMASPGGKAKLVYPDGCTVNVRPGRVVAVGKKSPCTAPYLVEGNPPTPGPSGGFAAGLGPAAAGAAGALGGFTQSTIANALEDDQPVSP